MSLFVRTETVNDFDGPLLAHEKRDLLDQFMESSSHYMCGRYLKEESCIHVDTKRLQLCLSFLRPPVGQSPLRQRWFAPVKSCNITAT